MSSTLTHEGDMVAVELKPIPHDDLEQFNRMFMRTMGFDLPSERVLERNARDYKSERSVGAYEDGRIVGCTHSHKFEITLPGGTLLPAAGVTAVGVITTHRRRGILTRLMERQLTEARGRTEPL